MNKKLVVALLLMALSALVLVFNAKGNVGVDLLIMSINSLRALVFLAFIVDGVLIGLLLK